MENLLLVRVDDRLIHGQVMTAWMKTLRADEIIVVDDRVAKDDFMLFVLQNAAPKGVKVVALSEDDAVAKLQEGLKVPSYILCKSPLSLRKIVDAGIDIKAVNIGGMGKNAERTTLYKNVSALSLIHISALMQGTELKIQAEGADEKEALDSVLALIRSQKD